MKVKDENYLQIEGWMRTRLNLKGSELLAYGLIYGFSQDGESWFSGSAGYVADWLGISRQQVLEVLKRLVEKGLIIRQDKMVNGVKLVDYRVNPERLTPCQETLQPPCQETLHHTDNTENTSPTKKERKAQTYDTILDERGVQGRKREAVLEWIRMRKMIKKPPTDRALELALSKLERMDSTEDGQVAILEQSIINGWQDLYPLRRQTEQKPVGKVAHGNDGYIDDFDMEAYMAKRRREG